MHNTNLQHRVDDLIKYFWKYGYLTISRKYGTYLPEPKQVGNYQIDAIGKQKKKYAIGIILLPDELDNPSIFAKLDFLATRNTKYSNRRVTLFLGIPDNLINKAKLIISELSDEARKNIKLVGIPDDKFKNYSHR